MNSRRFIWLSVALLAGSFCAQQLPAEDSKALSVKEFLATKKKWPNFAALNLPITIEGRLGGLSPRTMQLKKLSIPIIAMPGKQLPRLPKSTRHVQVTGHLERKGNRWRLIVHSAKANPSDSRVFLSRQIKLPVDKPKPWYDLADWAFDRAEFYGDKDLKQQAHKLLEHAFRLERLSLKSDDIAGRLNLAKKVKTLSLPPMLAAQLRHAAHRKRWSRYLLKNDPTYEEMLDGMKRDLPGFTTPLKAVPEKLANEYRKLPIQTFDKTDAKHHAALHRLLYLEMTMHRIKPTIKADGSNGEEIAARIEKLAPEWKSLAAMHREQGLQYRISRIGRLKRTDALALIELVKQRKSAKAANTVTRKWLRERETQLPPGSVRERIQLADDYNLFLKDRDRSIMILKRAHQQNAGAADVHKRMLAFGLVWNQGKWTDRGKVKPKAISAMERAIRDGRVLKGMRPVQVGRALAAKPTTILRVAGRRKFNEVWIFQLPNNNRIVVHFERSRDQSRREMKVVNVSPRR